MRYGLALIFAYMAGMAAASALPAVSPHTVSMSKTDPVAHVAKRGRPLARHRTRADNGIHPLVGSGNY